MSCDMSCEEETSSRPDGAGSVAMALRALEEAAEAAEAFKQYDRACTDVIHPKEAAPFMRAGLADALMGEIDDTIQACCDLAAALGVTDLTPYLAACEERNRKRGRYDG